MNMQVRLGYDSSGRARPARAASGVTLAIAAEQLDVLARQIGAQDHLVLRIGGTGCRTGSTLAPLLASAGLEGDADRDEIVRRVGQPALDHVERTLIPLVHARVPDRYRALKHLARLAPVPALKAPVNSGRDCAVFPVRLGALGNGLVILTGAALDLGPEDILSIHRRCYALFKDLLRIELRKAAPRQSLNERELECLQLAGEGLRSELIAQRLDLSVHTVNAYLGSAAAKLDAVNRIQAIAKAIRLGYMA